MKGPIEKRKYPSMLSIILFPILMFSAYGCATPQIRPVDKADFSGQLQFISDGTTTREEVLLKLGEPSGRFENDRILTYMLTIDGNRKLRVLPRQLAVSRVDPRIYELNPMACSLVLVFKKENILEKSELVCSGDEIK